MKANAVPRLLSSLVWIDQYNECNRMTSFMEFMTFITMLRTFQDFPGLSRTFPRIPGLSRAGKWFLEIQGLSRISRTCTNPDNGSDLADRGGGWMSLASFSHKQVLDRYGDQQSNEVICPYGTGWYNSQTKSPVYPGRQRGSNPGPINRHSSVIPLD